MLRGPIGWSRGEGRSISYSVSGVCTWMRVEHKSAGAVAAAPVQRISNTKSAARFSRERVGERTANIGELRVAPAT